ncbi:MAG: aspartate racemase [Thermoprotei archaeon]|nr:MAG: aspartate racemase [Thermoprotei archaeon]
MKRIGIVGGLSPESTIIYYKTIVSEYRVRHGNENYPVIIIYSVSFGLFTQLISAGRHREAAEMIVDAVKSLHRAGADFAIISANTPHMFYDYIREHSPIPVLSIIDALAEALKKDRVRVVGLLGTKFTLTHSFYKEGLRKHGIEAVVPDPSEIEIVNKIIYSELVKGVVRDESRYRVLGIVKNLLDKGAEGIALACTELPLLFANELPGVKLYDTARIHAIKALEYALS